MSLAKKVLKTRSQITSTLRNELYEEIKNLSDSTDIPISKLLDQAVELLLEDRRKRMYIDINVDEPRGSQRTPQSNKNQR
jgi:vacuolar-type H+-ATPase subunit E/Vma4